MVRRVTSTATVIVDESAPGQIKFDATIATIGGSTGANDNCLLRSDGAGGATLQATGIVVDDDNNIAWSGNLTQARIGGLWTDEPNFRPTPVEGVNITRLERVFIGAACDNEGVKIAGGSTDWLEARAPFTTANAELAVVAQSGRGAIVAALRSIDNEEAADNGIVLSLYAFNDNAAQVQQGFGLYVEAQRSAGAGFTTCVELDPVEFGIPVSIDPYSSSFTEVTSGIWLASGGEETSPNNVPVGLAILNNGAKFEKGIYFHKDSIDGTDGSTGTGTAIAMALGHMLDWYSAASTIGLSIYASAAGVLQIATPGVSTGAVDVEIGASRTGDGACHIDLHAAAGNDFEFRLLRAGGTNGVAQLTQAGTGPIQFIVNGAEDFRSDGGGIQLQAGKRLAVDANQVVAARRTGWTAWTGTADRATHVAGAGATAAQMSGALKALIDDLIAHGLIGA